MATINPDLRNAGEVNSRGGTFMAYKEVNFDGTDLTIPDVWHSMPYRSKSDAEAKEPLKPVNDESGTVFKREKDNFDFTLTITSLQDSAAVENALFYIFPGKCWAIFQDCGDDSSGKRKERFYGTTEIERSYKSSAPGRTVDIKICINAVPEEVTPATLPDWAYGKPSDFKIPAGEYHAVKASEKTVTP